jgi:hypothetical protein
MEVVVSVVILAFAVVPLLQMFQSGRQSAALTEYHVLAQLRARRILESFASFPYAALKALPEAEGGGVAPPLPPEDGFPPEYRKRVSTYEEMTFFEELSPGLGLLTVKIAWTPADRKKHEYLLQKIVSDEGLSLADRYPLRQKGAGFVK